MIPGSYLFWFLLELGYEGIWIGFPLASIFQTSSYLYIIYTAPWKEIALKASKEDTWNLKMKQN